MSDIEHYTLQQKFYSQEDQIAKLKKEQQKLNEYISQFKTKMLFSSMPFHNNAQERNKVLVQDPAKVSLQIDKEMQSAYLLLKNIQKSINVASKTNTKLSTQSLDHLDQQISNLKQQIKNCKEETKILQVVKLKQDKAIEKRKKQQDGGKLAKLIQQVKKQKQILMNVKFKHQQYQQRLNNKRKQVNKMQQIYHSKCKKNKQKPLTFKEFMEKREEKQRKNQQNKRNKKSKSIKTVRDIVKSQPPLSELPNTKRSLQELQTKKDIALTSLQNAEKKKQRQIKQLKQKLSLIQEENINLQKILVEKQKQAETTVQTIESNNEHNASSSKRLFPQI